MPDKLKIHSMVAEKINFASQQNDYPFLHELRLENTDVENSIEGVSLTVSSSPAFLTPRQWTFDSIGPGIVADAGDSHVALDGGFLKDLQETLRGTIVFTAMQGDHTIATRSLNVELLAPKEWGGSAFMPELLAAFSLPNDPSISRILREASAILQNAGKNGSMDGYQSKSSARVWEIAQAIYHAICAWKITYAVPPASFEKNGQKIRLPGEIADHRLATCLDTALLFAAALEGAGLNPIIALPDAHAVVGVWLTPEDLSTVVIDEAETLRKRIDLKELILIETTCVTKELPPPFTGAIASAKGTIPPEKDDSFTAAVDIRRARAHRILPLNLAAATAKPATSATEPAPQSVAAPLEQPPEDLPPFDENVEEEKPTAPNERLERWKRKLLDLTTRNPLLNHKISSRTCIPLACPHPGILEDKLAQGVKFSIVSPPMEKSARQTGIQQTGADDAILNDYAADALQKGQLVARLSRTDLGKHSVEIYRKAQNALQEGGANTLYLALGYLLWKKRESDAESFRAPLILLPIALERKSVRSGIKIVAHDDEARFNTTLLEMLRRDFDISIGALDSELPKDDNGIDVEKIWKIVRHAIRDARGFEVAPDVAIGHFSFAKYLMWKDLSDRVETLKENAVVSHLLGEPSDLSAPTATGGARIDARTLDQQFHPQDLLLPMPADASQIAAIATADKGANFIIKGPPGTGKSQTISNMIAHLLGRGKSVLFVSEKTAALEVVHRRLKDIGLDEFCLELHSNKANKAQAAKKLDNTRLAADASKGDVSGEWERQASALLATREHLNHYPARLHHPENEMTTYNAMGVCIRDAAILPDSIRFEWNGAASSDLAKLQESAQAMQTHAMELAENLFNPSLQLVAKREWSPAWQNKVVSLARQLCSAADEAEKAANMLTQAIGIPPADMSFKRLDALSEFAQALRDSRGHPTSLALSGDGSGYIDTLSEAAGHVTSYHAHKEQLSCAYAPMAWRQLDGDAIGRQWRESEKARWLARVVAQYRIRRILRKGGAQAKPSPAHDAPLLTRLRSEGEAIDRLDKSLSAMNIKAWQAHDSGADEMQRLHDLCKRLRMTTRRLADARAAKSATLATVQGISDEHLAPDEEIGKALAAFIARCEALSSLRQQFSDVNGKSVEKALADMPLSQTLDIITGLIQKANYLSDWCQWVNSREQAREFGMGCLVESIEKRHVAADKIGAVFYAAYCAWLAQTRVEQEYVLREFSKARHESDIANFQKNDAAFETLCAQHIRAQLLQKIAAARACASEDKELDAKWRILAKQAQLQRRHMPIRQLFVEIPEVIRVLAPCAMMSPLSVAQYLPVGQEMFDAVIFDEASQVTVWDAIGALARGRQAIVVGDPKQMPPTNFFQRGDEDPDGDVAYEADLESILEEMQATDIPAVSLNLHYRSRKEGLIAFSNRRYYDDKLIAFPAPHRDSAGIRLELVNGFYARGKTRQNEGEAKAIVQEILRRLADSSTPDAQKGSIGVVTFNTEQQSLIQDLLDKACQTNPDIEPYFSSDYTREPVFVKNLETVQGDERDVILFSVTYGADQNGHITMNFGPLNRQGGERRLNVAMTRARKEMVVFSTMKPDQINPSRVTAQGVRDLRDFLNYAKNGRLPATVFSQDGSDAPFESAVAAALQSKGWNTRLHVGASAYRIDIGIVHPKNPDIYLAGVECDGQMYHSAKVARERDRIRQEILTGLGWTLFRVWSTNWWLNPDGAMDALHRKLTELSETS